MRLASLELLACGLLGQMVGSQLSPYCYCSDGNKFRRHWGVFRPLANRFSQGQALKVGPGKTRLNE